MLLFPVTLVLMQLNPPPSIFGTVKNDLILNKWKKLLNRCKPTYCWLPPTEKKIAWPCNIPWNNTIVYRFPDLYRLKKGYCRYCIWKGRRRLLNCLLWITPLITAICGWLSLAAPVSPSAPAALWSLLWRWQPSDCAPLMKLWSNMWGLIRLEGMLRSFSGGFYSNNTYRGRVWDLITALWFQAI